jgi:hypothetical protein
MGSDIERRSARSPCRGQQNSRLGFHPIQHGDVAGSGQIRASPQNVMAVSSKQLYNRLWKVLIGEKAHLHWNRECLVFVPGQTRVIGEDFAFRLAGRQEFQNELDRKTRPRITARTLLTRRSCS